MILLCKTYSRKENAGIFFSVFSAFMFIVVPLFSMCYPACRRLETVMLVPASIRTNTISPTKLPFFPCSVCVDFLLI